MCPDIGSAIRTEFLERRKGILHKMLSSWSPIHNEEKGSGQEGDNPETANLSSSTVQSSLKSQPSRSSRKQHKTSLRTAEKGNKKKLRAKLLFPVALFSARVPLFLSSILGWGPLYGARIFIFLALILHAGQTQTCLHPERLFIFLCFHFTTEPKRR